MPNKTIPTEEQVSICSTIKALCESHAGYDAERQHLLFVGVMIALKNALPPYWSINIHCRRTDRIMDTVIGFVPTNVFTGEVE